MTYDPFTATMLEALAQPDADAPGGPVQRWLAAYAITEARAELEQNPLDGVALCVAAGFVTPDWLASAFMRQFNKVVNYEVATLDEAFPPAPPTGRNELRPLYLTLLHKTSEPRKTGEHLSTLRLRRQYGTALNELFNFLPKLPRTLAGRKVAAQRLGITEKQVRTLSPTTRTNVKGHKPYGAQASAALSANDQFSITRGKVPKN